MAQGADFSMLNTAEFERDMKEREAARRRSINWALVMDCFHWLKALERRRKHACREV